MKMLRRLHPAFFAWITLWAFVFASVLMVSGLGDHLDGAGRQVVFFVMGVASGALSPWRMLRDVPS